MCRPPASPLPRRPWPGLGLLLALLLAPGVGGAADVLLLAPSVAQGEQSVEAAQAQALGLGVDVVEPSTFATMTAAQFAAYRAIVLGRPEGCEGAAPMLAAAEASQGEWGAVVGGNLLAVVADPSAFSLWGGSTPAGEQLARDGLSWAVGQPGRTGLYANLSCAYASASAGTTASVLSPFGAFTVQGECSASQHVVDAEVLAGLGDADVSSLLCAHQAVFTRWPQSFAVAGLSTAVLTPVYRTADGVSGAPFALARGAEDRAPPLVWLGALPTLVGQQPLQVGGTVEDAGSLSRVTWYVNGKPVATSTPGAAGEVGASLSLASGANTLLLEALDAAGNRSVAEAKVTYDASAPALSLSGLSPTLRQPRVDLTGRATAPAGIAAVRLRVNGALTALPPLASDGSFRTAAPLVEGWNAVTVEAETKAVALPLGGSTPPLRTSLTTRVQVDTVPPSVKLEALPALTRTPRVQVRGQALDSGTGVRRVTLHLGGQEVARLVPSERGTFAADVTLAEGANTLVATAEDGAGNEASTQATLALDTTAPSLVLHHPAPGSAWASTTVELEVGVEDRSATTVTIGGQAQTLPAGGGRAQGTAQLAGEGTQTVWASAEDAAGNRALAQVDVVLDQSAPLLALDVAPGTALARQEGDVLLFHARVDDFSETTLQTPSGTYALPAGGGLVAASAALVEGENTVTVSAVDATGVSATLSRTVVYDLTPPEGRLTLPAGARVRGTVELGVEATDALTGVASVALTLDGAPLPAPTCEAPGSCRVAVDTSVLADGTHGVEATLVDGVGNRRTLTASLDVDNTPPVARVDSPADGAQLRGTVTLTASASDAAGPVASLAVRVNGLTVAGCASAPACSATLDTMAMPDGPFRVSASATDVAGNTSSVAEVTLVADNAAPERFLKSPLSGSTVGASLTVALEVTDSGFREAECFVDGTSLGTTSSRTFRTEVDLLGTLDGPVGVRCEARDWAGNVGEERADVTLDSWREALEPRRLRLHGQGKEGGTVEMTVEGPNVSLLLPVASRALALGVPGGSPVAVDARRSDAQATDRDGDGVPEVRLRVDRKALVRSIEASIASGDIDASRPFPVRLLSGSRQLGMDLLTVEEAGHGAR